MNHNFSNLKLTCTQRGIDCENIVIKYFLNKGWKLVKQRFKTPFAEIDLIFENSKKSLLIVEVKSMSQQEFITYRISNKQKARLFRARQYIESCLQDDLIRNQNREVMLHWAFVNSKNQITLLEAE